MLRGTLFLIFGPEIISDKTDRQTPPHLQHISLALVSSS